MQGRQPYERPRDDGADLIASGADREVRGPLLPPNWRRRLTLALVLAAGLAVGGYGGYVWPESSAGDGGAAVDLRTRITDIDGLYQAYPPYRLAVRVTNEGAHPVRVERMEPAVPGLQVATGPAHPQFVRPGESATTLYAVQPECAERSPRATAPVRLRARTQSGATRVVTVSARVAPGVRDGYAILCGEPPAHLVLAAKTLRVERRDGGLFVRLELAATGSPAVVPSELRVLRVGLDGQAFDAVRLPDRGGSSLPATVELELEADCDDLGGPVRNPVLLRVGMTSAEGPRLGYAHTDTRWGTALRGYLADRCGPRGR